VAKYLDHMPLERQVRIMRREGLTIDSQTLWDQIHALSRHLRPTYEALGKRARTAEVMHVAHLFVFAIALHRAVSTLDGLRLLLPVAPSGTTRGGSWRLAGSWAILPMPLPCS
jgi:hypothetical protein